MRAPRPCAAPGCPATVANTRRCSHHAAVHAQRETARRAVADRARPSARARGYGTDWEKLRPQILARDPMCVSCGVKPSKHVDHVVARRAGGTDEPSNLQGLCHRCHSSKTAQHDGSFGNALTRGAQLRAAAARVAR